MLQAVDSSGVLARLEKLERQNRRMKRAGAVALLLAGAVLFVATVPIVCGGQEVPLVIASSVHWAESRDSRRGQAAEWLAEISKIDKQIPTLSPAEQA